MLEYLNYVWFEKLINSKEKLTLDGVGDQQATDLNKLIIYDL